MARKRRAIRRNRGNGQPGVSWLFDLFEVRRTFPRELSGYVNEAGQMLARADLLDPYDGALCSTASKRNYVTAAPNTTHAVTDANSFAVKVVDCFAVGHYAPAATSRAMPIDGHTHGSPLRVTP
jgi:hypothetical protein